MHALSILYCVAYAEQIGEELEFSSAASDFAPNLEMPRNCYNMKVNDFH
jgi:hypothetical protein